MADSNTGDSSLESLLDLVTSLILDSSYLLVATGAGYSADSGLPVYRDVADIPAYTTQKLHYDDLCRPYLIEENPQLSYGFWGTCYNSYQDTPPHEGYAILQRWRDLLFTTTPAAQIIQDRLPSTSATAFFSYTSNVDGHFRRFFPPSQVAEIHGSTDYWQCCHPDNCVPRVWTLPEKYRFQYHPETRLLDIGQKGGEGEGGVAARDVVETYRGPSISVEGGGGPCVKGGVPTCIFCGGPARPNVLMFGDDKSVGTAYEEVHYVQWEDAVEMALRDKGGVDQETVTTACNACELSTSHLCMNQKRSGGLLILEMGCGLRVPSVRMETRDVLHDINQRCPSGVSGCTLVRINPDIGPVDPNVVNDFVGIPCTGLYALREIDRRLQQRLKQ